MNGRVLFNLKTGVLDRVDGVVRPPTPARSTDKTVFLGERKDSLKEI